MRSYDLFEIHDHRWCPGFLRNLFTDALQAVWERFDTYKPIVPLLRQALEESDNNQVIDLCSGAGGPWPQLIRDLNMHREIKISVLLTDLHPNPEGLEQSHSDCEYLNFYQHSVSALAVPSELRGFRTIFSSFHHFGRSDAQSILSDAVKRGEGLAIFEGAKRDLRTMLVICFLPIIVLVITPTIPSFRWSRIFWTYVIPIVPFMIWFDGLLSCLRAYSKDELWQMSQSVQGTDYEWQVGTRGNGFVSITYLIGYSPVLDKG